MNDETDPDCHTPGIIYQQADDTVIDATVETTGTDWATRCRALGKTVGPLAAGHGGNEPHTFEETTRTRQISSTTSGCITITVVALDDGRRDRTVFDCREGGAHITPAGDGHAHEWLTEPWEPWQWTETGRRANINNNNCPQDTPNFDPIDFPPSGEGGREEAGTTSTNEGDRVPQGTTIEPDCNDWRTCHNPLDRSRGTSDGCKSDQRPRRCTDEERCRERKQRRDVNNRQHTQPTQHTQRTEHIRP